MQVKTFSLKQDMTTLTLQRLKANGYIGAYTIEREIEGQQQKADILSAVNYLKSLFLSL